MGTRQRIPLSLSIAREPDEKQRVGNKLDYLPFGVKTLKVQVAGDYRGKLRLAPLRRSPVVGETFAHEDQSETPQFVVSWGGGQEGYYELKYPKKRIVHFLVRHIGDALDDRLLTIVATKEDGDQITLPVNLTCPTMKGKPCSMGTLIKPTWQEVIQGPNGESDIRLIGHVAPDYISRWWPHNRVKHVDDGERPPRLRVRYRRLADGDSGSLAVYATDAPGGDEVLLARIQGCIPYPLYDMQQVVPELYRFDARTWALRIWFFWLYKVISYEDLSQYGTRSKEERQHSWQALRSEKEGGLAKRSWQEGLEIPDAERVDIVFSNDLEPLYAATDLHWREMWGRNKQPSTPIVVRIMNTRAAALAKDWRELRKALEGWGTVIVSLGQEGKYNPQPEVALDLAGKGKLAASPLATQSNTPAIMSIVTQPRFTSTDVRDG
jgi:hypothetical protein